VIDLNLDHPEFDLISEIACSIPHEPARMPGEIIASDFGLDGGDDILEVEAQLKEQFGVKWRKPNTKRGEIGRQYYYPLEQWVVIRRILNRYWRKVNGDA